MALNYPRNGLNHVGAYQVSAIPFVTSSVPNEVPGPDSNSLSKPITVAFLKETDEMTFQPLPRMVVSAPSSMIVT